MEQYQGIVQFILDQFVALSVRYPVIASIIVVMGSMRFWAKPAIEFGRKIVAMTATKKDDEFLEKAEKHPVVKGILWAVDYVLSIKPLK